MKTHTLSLLAALALCPVTAFAQAGGNPADTDADGLTDTAEAALGTDPEDADTDDDGLPDGAEVNVHFTSPLECDTDDDGLCDGDEITAGTEPLDADSDDDHLDDQTELSANTDPLTSDSDNDGLCDGDELAAATDPADPDTDNDGVPDETELSAHTDPLRADTDNDGLRDSTELAVALDPTEPDSDLDVDQMREAIVSLLRNAVYSAARSPMKRARVATRRVGESMQLAVQDSGPLFSEAAQASAFELSSVQDLDSMSLAVAAAVVRQHGGRITMRSQEGSGNTVMIEIPLSAQAPTS